MTIPALPTIAAPAHERSDRRFHVDERIPGAIQRIASGQFDRMTHRLNDPDVDPDEAIHTARKAMKRLRGLLRLVRDEVGQSAYRNENAVLRDTSRRLAPVRDSFVMLRTLDRLREAHRGVLRRKAFAVTRQHLMERHEASRRAVIENDQLMTAVVVTLKTARARYTAWESERTGNPPSKLAARGVRDDFAAMAPGLTRVYRRGQRAMLQAYHDGSAESFHEWRKRVKYLRYQLESLELIWPELVGAHAECLAELGEALGDNNDLAELGRIVLDDDAATANQRERTLLLALIHSASLELQYEARALGSALYTETPDQFVGRLGSYWNASRGIAPTWL
jgi:CHAD domain-containing protein